VRGANLKKFNAFVLVTRPLPPFAKGGQGGMMYLIFVLQIEHIGLEFNIKVIPFFSSPCPLYLREAVTVGGGYKERGIS
jgi:hypothetical protein